MTPRVPVELIARLAGILLVGLCAPGVLAAVVQSIVVLPWTPPASRAVLDWIAVAVGLILEEASLRTAGGFLLRHWAPLLGLTAGGYFFFGGVWPLRWVVRRELKRG